MSLRRIQPPMYLGRPLLALISAGVALGCGTTPAPEAPAPPPPSPESPAPSPPPTGPAPADTGENTAPPVSQNCQAQVGDKCFASAEEACAAIGCPKEKCVAAYSFPMQVSCQ